MLARSRHRFTGPIRGFAVSMHATDRECGLAPEDQVPRPPPPSRDVLSVARSGNPNAHGHAPAWAHFRSGERESPPNAGRSMLSREVVTPRARWPRRRKRHSRGQCVARTPCPQPCPSQGCDSARDPAPHKHLDRWGGSGGARRPSAALMRSSKYADLRVAFFHGRCSRRCRALRSRPLCSTSTRIARWRCSERRAEF